MKVAVFGCLHGMLNDMYRAVECHENQTKTKIDFVIVCGDCQTVRHYDDLTCLSVPNKYKKVGDFHEYYSGKKKIPKLTIFVGGNHEASNYLMTLPYGGWVCDNFYYLGYAGVIKYRGLRIAGVSGIYNFRNCNKGRFECMPLDDQSIRSIYHTRRLDIFRLQLLSKNAEENNPIDVFLSHDWPARVYDHGNLNQLLRFKPAFRADVDSRDGLGNPMTQPLIGQLKPKRWFAAHLHCKFYAKVEHDPSKGRYTEFLSLNKIESGRSYVEFLDLLPHLNESQQKVAQNEESDDKEEEHDDGADSNNDNDQDDELYYDEEWLAILRKTISLENDSRSNVYCPTIDDDSGKAYFPTEKEIMETVELMNQTGGLKINRNFQMTEPVIYNRPDNANASVDRNRTKYFPNPQHEELCSRLQIKSLLHRHQASSSSNVQTSSTDEQTKAPNNVRHNSNYHNSNYRNSKHSSRAHQSARAPAGFNQDQSARYYQPNKKRAFELDEDGCLPFYIDKKGEK